MSIRKFPAEWEPHEATWIAWPHNEEDWPGLFEKIGPVYVEIVRALHQHERVEILCDSEVVRKEAQKMCKDGGIDLSGCRFHIVPNDRSWMRDSGPTAVKKEDGSIAWVGWQFNGWAKYDNWKKDQHVSRAIVEFSGMPFVEAMRPDGKERLVLEGGAIETNGAGVLMTTEECLLSREQERNPGMTKGEYEKVFAEHLGIEKVIWLGKGCVGDDTHGHIDDIARFASEDTILLAYEENQQDPNYESSVDHLKRLYEVGLRKIIKVPYPKPIFIQGERVPASYLNFYIANGIVLVPQFGDQNDAVALKILGDAFPEREITGFNCRDLIWGLGTLHCLTQQQPS
jgi:agmatine deiminase